MSEKFNKITIYFKDKRHPYVIPQAISSTNNFMGTQFIVKTPYGKKYFSAKEISDVKIEQVD